MRVRARARPLTSPPPALLLAVAVALALAGPPASGGVVFAAGAKMPRGGVRMSSKTQASMPGLEDDPVMRRALKCNACHVVVGELIEGVRSLRSKKRRALTPDETTTRLEATCLEVRGAYGLQMRDDAVTPVYSKHAAVARAEGNWISNYLANACGEVVRDHDDVIADAAEGLRVRGGTTPGGADPFSSGATGDAFRSGEADAARATCCGGRSRRREDADEDDDEDVVVGLGVCPEDADWSRVNTHDDGWSSYDAVRDANEKKKEL